MLVDILVAPVADRKEKLNVAVTVAHAPLHMVDLSCLIHAGRRPGSARHLAVWMLFKEPGS